MFSTKSQVLPGATPDPAETPKPQSGAPAAQPPMSPEAARKAAEASDQRAAAFGRIMAIMSASNRHNKLTLRELTTYVTPAIALGQFAMVGAQQQQGGPMSVAAVVWWAMVSPEVDKRLSDSTSEFLHVEGKDWKSGGQPWVIDTVGEPKIVGELLKKLSESTFKATPAKIRAAMPDGRMAVGYIKPKEA